MKCGITVNAISPSAETEMTATIPDNIGDIKGARGLTHGGRAATRTGQPHECAPIVTYLCSDEAQEITGQIFGIGADRLSLYSHPDPKIRIFHEGGWTVELVRERPGPHGPRPRVDRVAGVGGRGDRPIGQRRPCCDPSAGRSACRQDRGPLEARWAWLRGIRAMWSELEPGTTSKEHVALSGVLGPTLMYD